MDKLLTISEVAAASGLSADTIRYYEHAGVLPPVQRAENSYRSYPVEHVETLRFARRLRELGLAPSAMTDLIRLFHDGTCRQMRDALAESCDTTLAKVRAQLLELGRVESQLREVLEGLEHAEVDDDRISTVTPSPCVAVVEREASPVRRTSDVRHNVRVNTEKGIPCTTSSSSVVAQLPSPPPRKPTTSVQKHS